MRSWKGFWGLLLGFLMSIGGCQTAPTKSSAPCITVETASVEEAAYLSKLDTLHQTADQAEDKNDAALLVRVLRSGLDEKRPAGKLSAELYLDTATRLGRVLIEEKQYKEALETSERALLVAQQGENSLYVASLLIIKGDAHAGVASEAKTKGDDKTAEQEDKQALEWYQKAKERQKQTLQKLQTSQRGAFYANE